MDWVLPLPAKPSGWDRPDLPLRDDLPSRLLLDVSGVRQQPAPLFAVRLRIFIDWHRSRGRVVALTELPLPLVADLLAEAGFGDLLPDVRDLPSPNDMIVPVTRMEDELAVDEAAERVRALIERDLSGVAVLGAAVFQAISELCSNALQHGRHDLGVYFAARRILEPRRQIEVAIGDLGMGIPEHLRGRHPEWRDDEHAIAQAMEPGVSGTGDPHRGYGFHHTFDAALTAGLHAATIEVHSANGYVRRQIVQETRKTEALPMPRFRRGTLISWAVTSAMDSEEIRPLR